MYSYLILVGITLESPIPLEGASSLNRIPEVEAPGNCARVGGFFGQNADLDEADE